MEQAHKYIKRLLAFLFCVFLYFFSVPYISSFISIPLLLLTFSILHSRITNEKPPHLFAFYRTDSYFKKGGLRDLIRIFVTLFGFIYDVIIWTVWGIYLVFILFIDILDLLKTIAYWIIHALLWVFRQYVPFIIFLYKIFIHYVIHWCWWLYQIAYYNIRYAYNKNCYRVALWGTLQATVIVFIFYFLEVVLLDIPGITLIGVIIALLPLSWSFGEIATIRVQKLENEPFKAVKLKFQNGIESVRSILFYITLFVILLLAQLGMNLLGWIPKSGVVIVGILFNINTFISLMLLFISVLNVLGVIIIPSYRLYTPFSELKFSDTVDLLKTILRKFLQYFIITVPKLIFSLIIIVIPLVVMILVGTLTYNLKNGVIDIKINRLKTEQASTDDMVTAYTFGKRVEHLEYLKQFPLELSQEINHRKILNNELILSREDLKSEQEEFLKNSEDYKNRISQLQLDIDEMTGLNRPATTIDLLTTQKSQLQEKYRVYEYSQQVEIGKLQTDIEYLDLKRKQFPILFFFGGLWLAIFGGMVLAFIVAYFGNVYHQVYIFRNDNEQSEWMKVIEQIRAKDTKQPLLGASLFIVTGLLVYLLFVKMKMLTSLLTVFSGIFL